VQHADAHGCDTPFSREAPPSALQNAQSNLNAMIVGYHITFAAYGFWLPNDPRGSWSTFVGADRIFRAGGRATQTIDRRSLAKNPHDVQERVLAKDSLKRPPLRFNGRQARSIARGFRKYIKETQSLVWACAILPDHIHLVVGRLPMTVEQFVIQMKGAAIKQLLMDKLHPYARLRDAKGRLPKCFVQGHWADYLAPGGSRSND